MEHLLSQKIKTIMQCHTALTFKHAFVLACLKIDVFYISFKYIVLCDFLTQLIFGFSQFFILILIIMKTDISKLYILKH